MKIEFEVWFSRKASKELRSLRPVFEQLSKVHEDYTNAEPGPDFSFWYSERPQIGLLSAAVWLRGKTALEEYAAPKENGKKRCRGDLYIRTGKNTTFECEAKHLTLNLGKSTAELVRNAEKHVDKAAKEAILLTEARHYLGLCFLTPWGSESTPDRDRRCLQVIDRLKPTNIRSHCDALVWIHGRTPVHRKNKKKLYPGLLLAVKEATKAKAAR